MLKRSSSSSNNYYQGNSTIYAPNRIRPVSYLQYSSTFQRPPYQPISTKPSPPVNPSRSYNNNYIKAQTPKLTAKIQRDPIISPYATQIKTINKKRDEITKYKKDESSFLEKNNLNHLLSSLKKEIIEIRKNIQDTDAKV